VLPTRGYAAQEPGAALAPFDFERRDPGPRDVAIDILYCGVCHSDIHQARDEWGGAIFPMVPGHEIVGRVTSVGTEVRRWSAGDVVGVGVMVDSDRECEACKAGEEQYCERGASWTYNGREQDGVTPTYGGYSTRIVVDEAFVLRVPEGMPLDATAPLLCAGVTTFSPLHHFGVRAGDSLAVVGLGGLGHLGVKFGRALGATVTVLSHSPRKRDDAMRLGAHHFIATNDDSVFQQHEKRFDFILDTVSAEHDYNGYLRLLRRDGTMMLVGIPDPSLVKASSLIEARRRLTGSNIGGLRETQEMLDLCARQSIAADIETISMDRIAEAWDRTVRSDVRYRFVIDLSTLDGPRGA